MNLTTRLEANQTEDEERMSIEGKSIVSVAILLLIILVILNFIIRYRAKIMELEVQKEDISNEILRILQDHCNKLDEHRERLDRQFEAFKKTDSKEELFDLITKMKENIIEINKYSLSLRQNYRNHYNLRIDTLKSRSVCEIMEAALLSAEKAAKQIFIHDMNECNFVSRFFTHVNHTLSGSYYLSYYVKAKN